MIRSKTVKSIIPCCGSFFCYNEVQDSPVNFKSYFIILLLSCYSLAGWPLDPATEISEYGRRLWTNENGLPQNTILSMKQTRDGYLWMGTQAGLARFDGVQFHIFSSRNAPIKNNDIIALAEDPDGGLWLGTYGGGIVRHQDGKFTVYGRKEGLTDEAVRSLHIDWRGVLWIGTRSSGLFSFEKGKFVRYSTEDGLVNNIVRTISEDHDGNLWIGTENGLSRLHKGVFTSFTVNEGLPSNSIRCIFPDRLGRIWIATDGGIALIEDGKLRALTTKDGGPDEPVRYICEDRDRNIWIATEDGLKRLQGGKLSAESVQGLPSDPILVMQEDHEGNLWIGTDGGGVVQLRDLKFSNFSGPVGLPDKTAYSVLEDHSGAIWIGTRTSGLIRWKEGQSRVYSLNDKLLSNTIFGLYEDPEKNLWVGTRGGGINLIKDEEVTTLTISKELSNLTVRAMLKARDGSFWIGTNSGLNLWRDGKFKTFTTRDGLSHDFTHSLLEDRNGTVWIGTFRGLTLWKNGKFIKIQTPEPLAESSIWSVLEDSDGVIWAASYGAGLFRIENERITAITSRNGLFEDTILSFVEDNDRNLWMCTYRGIFKVAKMELNDFANGRIERVHSQVFDVSDGMKSSEGVGGVQPSAWKTRTGKLLFLTVRGMTAIDPRNIRTNPLAPPVHLEQVLYDEETIDLKNSVVQLQPGQGNLEFHYTALSFAAPEKVRFRYQLQGFDTDWVDASVRRVAYYTKVPPGEYQFQVTACNNDGKWNETAVVFSMKILPHFYQTFWFYALWALVAVIAGFAVHRQRIKGLQTEFSAVFEERNRISREIHDTLTQNFTAVVLQLETAEITLSEEPETAKDTLRRAQELARSGLSESRRFVKALRPAPLEHSDLVVALSIVAAQAVGGSDVDYEVKIHGTKRQLAQVVEDNLLRITQEAINNVVKHAKAGWIRIDLTYSFLRTVLRIADDGCGFDTANPISKSGGFGLTSMKERATQIHGRIHFASTIGKGTEIIITVPRW